MSCSVKGQKPVADVKINDLTNNKDLVAAINNHRKALGAAGVREVYVEKDGDYLDIGAKGGNTAAANDVMQKIAADLKKAKVGDVSVYNAAKCEGGPLAISVSKKATGKDL